jgi:beta-lactamase regulating signal transducer with metallopeptidase domain
MTTIEVAAWLLSTVLLKGSVIGAGAVLAARTGVGQGAWGMGSLLAGLMLLLAPVVPALGSGFVSVPHDAIRSVAFGPIVVSPVAVFVAVWTTGVVLLLLRLVGEVGAATALVRASAPAGRRSNALMHRAATAIGCIRIPELRETPALATAALVGFRRPVLLLPVRARDWSDDELFGVLCHELEHARRNDWVKLLVERIVNAIFWINPLVHLLTRQAAAAREMVADEAALRAGTPVSVYAGRLIAVARELRAPSGLAVSVPFVSGSVDARVRALFAEGRHGSSPSLRQALITVMPLVLALAAFEPWTCLP